MTEAAFRKAVARWEPDSIAAVRERPEWATARDARGRTTLHLVAAASAEKLGREPEDALPIAESLLASGADINATHDVPDAGETIPATPLWYAIARGKNAVLARYLLERGADATSCLWVAVWEDDAELLTTLLETRPPTESRLHGETPLLYACKLGRWEMVRILREFGASPDAPDARGMMPRDYAKRRNAPRDVLAMLGGR